MRKKVVAFIIGIVLIIGGFIPYNIVNAIADNSDTTALKLRLLALGRPRPDETTKDGIPVYKYYSGESVLLRVDFEASGTDVNIPNGSIRIWLPKNDKNYIRHVGFVDSVNAINTVRSGDNDPKEFSVRYDFNDIKGGDVGAYPLNLKFENLITPNGVRQPVYAAVLNEDGTVAYQKKLEIVIESKAKTAYTGDKYVNGYHSWSTFLGEYSVAERPTATPTDVKSTRTVFTNQFEAIPPQGAQPDQGEYRATGFKFVDTIPEGAVFLKDDPVNVGWEQDTKNPRVYTKILWTKDNPTLSAQSTVGANIALSFPNQPYDTQLNSSYKGFATKNFVNSTDFSYYNDTDFVSVATNKTASINFYVREQYPGDFSWDKYANEVTNVVNVDKDAHNEQIFFKPNSTASTGISVWPKSGETQQHKAWTWTTDFSQWQRDSGGQAQYLYEYVDSNQGIQSSSDSSYVQSRSGVEPNKGRMYYKSVTVSKASFYNNNAVGATKSTADWVNEHTKFKVCKTFAPMGGFAYSADSRSTNNLYLTMQKKVCSGPYSMGDTVEINDRGGYYTGIAIVFDDEDLHNVDAQGHPIRALPIQNMNFHIDFDMRPVMAGATSVKEDGTIWTAPANWDLLKEFSNLVLGHVGDGTSADGLSRAKNDYITYTAYGAILSSTGNSVNPPQYVGYNSTDTRSDSSSCTPPSGGSMCWSDEENVHGGYSDNIAWFRPNFNKLDLSTSGDETFEYRADPKKMQYTGFFHGHIPTDSTSLSNPESLIIKDLKGIVLLPTGVEYVKTTNYGKSLGEPDVIYNYRNTGRTAVVYHFGDMQGDDIGTVEYVLQLTKYAKDAATGDPTEKHANTVDTWLSWKNNLNILANSGADLDVMDLNSDGSQGQLDHRTYDLYLNMSKEIMLRKTVSLDNKSWELQSPFQDIDGTVYFRLKVINRWTSPITTMTGIDVLPAKGDYKTVANNDGVYLLRGHNQKGSDFDVRLAGPVEDVEGNGVKADGDIDFPEGTANDKFTFYYSMATPQQKNPEVVPDSSWKTKNQIAPNDWSKVRAFKFVLKKGKEIPAALDPTASEELKKNFKKGSNEVAVFVKAKTENNRAIANQKVAYNSVAYFQGAGRTFNEGNEVSVNTIRYTVNGVAFRDYNLNGSVSNQVYSGVKAQLVYAKDVSAENSSDGKEHKALEPVDPQWVDSGKLDAKGDIVPLQEENNETITDQNGKYYFIVYKRGEYRVKFTRPDSLLAHTNDTVTVLDNHSSNIVHNTDGNVDESSVSDTSGANGADTSSASPFVQCGSQIGINRSNADRDNSDTPFTDNKRNENVAYSTAFVLNPSKLRYNDNGKLKLYDGSIYQTRNIAFFDGKQTVNLHKIGLDKNGKSTGSLVGTKFALYKRNGDNQGAKIEEQTTDKDGNAQFVNLAYGDYFLAETEATKGYQKADMVKITISKPQGCMNGSDNHIPSQIVFTDMSGQNSANRFSYNSNNSTITVSDIPILGTIKIVKKSTDNPQKVLQGIRFGLYRFGKPVMDNTNPNSPKPLVATTDNNGIATFADIAGGDYVVKELNSIERYSNNMTVDGKTINLREDGYAVSVPVDKDPTTNIVNVNLTNDTVVGSIKINKKDADTDKPIAGVKFSLYKANGGETAPSANAQAIATAVTDQQGIAEFNSVKYGRYFVKEITPAPGYIPNTDVYPVFVQFQGRAVNPTYGSWIKNTAFKASVKIKKVDDDDIAKAVDGATYSLYKCSGVQDHITLLKACDIHENAAFATESTADGGFATFTNIPYGNYILQETSAPAGYVVSEKKTEVHVTMDNANKQNDGTYLIDLTSNANILKDSRIKGIINLKKVDSLTKNALAGAQFALYAKKSDGSFATDVFVYKGKTFKATTDNEGLISFTDVPYGEYQLKEISAPQGYKLDTDIRTVDIVTNGQQVNFTSENTANTTMGWFADTPKLYSVHVTKIDAVTKTHLKGAQFELRQNGQRMYGPLSTGKDGTLSFTKVRMGDYQLMETGAPEGYLLAASQNVSVRGEDNAQIAVTVGDQQIFGNVRFTKVDATDYAKNPRVYTPLKGVTFQIFRAVQDSQTGKWLKSGDEIQQVITKSDGVVEFTKLPKGHYVIEETGAANGYNKADDLLPVEIIDNDVTVSPTQDGYYTNKVITANVRVKKLGTTGNNTANQPLAGVEFALQQTNSSGAVVNKYTATTGVDGIATFTGVVFGKYTLVEIKPLEGYNPAVTDTGKPIVRDVTVNAEGHMYDFTDVAGQFINKRITGTIELTKVDALNHNRKLSGAVYLLEQHGKVIYTFPPTDNDGIARLDNVIYGTYDLVEKTAPVGYNLNKDKQSIVISKQGEQRDVTVQDSIITGSVTALKQGTVDATGKTVKVLPGVIFQLLQANDFDQLVRGTDGNPIVKYTATTDSEGLVHFTNVAFGHYKLVEYKTLKNYQKSAEMRDVVILKQNQQVNFTDTSHTQGDGYWLNRIIFAKNLILEGVVKTDTDTGKPIVGAVFKLVATDGQKSSDGKTPLTYISDPTDNHGVIQFHNVIYGDYNLIEKNPAKGYILSKEPRTVLVRTTAEKVSVGGGNYNNEKIKGNVTFRKVDAQTGKALAGATFGLFNDGSSMNDGGKKESNNSQIPLMKSVSDSNGIVRFEDVAYGNYEIRELSAPTGYVVSDKKLDFAVVSNGKTIELDQVADSRVKADVAFYKVDSACKFENLGQIKSNDSKDVFSSLAHQAEGCRKLSGAKFELVPSQTNLFPRTYTAISDSAGLVHFTGVYSGTYSLREIKAPLGYFKKSQEIPVVVGSEYDGNIVALSPITNKRIPSLTIRLHKTSGTLAITGVNSVSPILMVISLAFVGLVLQMAYVSMKIKKK